MSIFKGKDGNGRQAKGNKRFGSFVVEEGSPEQIWLDNQVNKSKSIRFVIDFVIDVLGKGDLFEAVTDNVPELMKQQLIRSIVTSKNEESNTESTNDPNSTIDDQHK